MPDAFVTIPARKTDTGAGAAVYASASQPWKGTIAPLTKRPQMKRAHRHPCDRSRGGKRGSGLFEGNAAGREKEESEGGEHENAGDCRKDQVFPSSLEGGLALVQGDQDEGRHRRHFDEDVEGEQVAHHRNAVHADERDEEQVGKV